MKHKFSLIWRVAVALVLVLSFSLVAAVPVMAQPTDGVDGIEIEDVSGAVLYSIPATGSFYTWVRDEIPGTDATISWNTDPFVQETGQVKLQVIDGAGNVESTHYFTATEQDNNNELFRTDAISVASLGVKPGYELKASIAGTALNDSAWVQAEISFGKSVYSIDESMTVTLEDDQLNTSPATLQSVTIYIDKKDIANIGTALTLVETGKDTGVFQVVVTPNAADTGGNDDIWCSDAMMIIYEDPDNDATAAEDGTTGGSGNDGYPEDLATVGADGDNEITAIAYVSPTSPSTVSFSPATIAPADASVKVVVVDRDESSDTTDNDELISNAVVVKSLAADDSVLDSLTVATLTEHPVGGQFEATVTFGAGATQLDITGAAKLQATYSDPSDPSDVSTATAPIGTTVDLYDAIGTLHSSYTTIQAAANAAGTPGWTVKVSEAYNSATESFPIQINVAGLTVESVAGAASTIIDASATPGNVIFINAAAVTIGGSDCGFTIIGDRTGAQSNAVLFKGGTATNPTVQGNIITGNLTRGIYAEWPCRVTIKDNIITATVTSIAPGILLEAQANSVIENNDVSGFAIGIRQEGGGTASWATPITISNNECHGNTFEGIALDVWNDHLQYVLVCGNDAYDNGTHGIGIYEGNPAKNAEEIKVVGNNLYNNGGAGLYVDDLTANTSDADTVYVFGNNIYGNTSTVGSVTTDDYGVMNHVSNKVVPADHNWWGDASGPSPLGTGDAVSANVAYTPWLGASVSAAKVATASASLDAKSEVGVTVSGATPSGVGTADIIGAARYTTNPVGTPEFTPLENGFSDVYVYDAVGWATTDEIVLKFYAAGIDADSKAYAWDPTEDVWRECTLQGYSSYGGAHIWVKVHSELNITAPTIPPIEGLEYLPFAISVEEVRTLQSIAVTPATASIGVGGTKQFTATGTYNLAPLTEDITATVTWASSVLGVATIDAAGLATGVAEGTTNITATLGTIVSDPVAVLTVSVFDVYELYDADEDGVISKSEATTAVVDYFDGTITKDQALLVIVEYMG